MLVMVSISMLFAASISSSRAFLGLCNEKFDVTTDKRTDKTELASSENSEHFLLKERDRKQ
jgi:hypothetical protein